MSAPAQAPSAPAPPPSTLRTFYVLGATQLFSLIGSRASGIAVGLWLYARTGDTLPLLVGAFWAELPAMLLGGVGGALADRYERRVVLALGDAGQALGTLLLLASVALGRFQVWHLYLAMGVQGVFAALQGPALHAAVGSLAPPHLRDRANGLMQMGFPLAGTVAPALGGLLFSALGLEGVLAVDLATFLVAVSVVLRLAIPRPAPDAVGEAGDAPPTLRGELLAGWRYLAARRALLALVVYVALIDWLINGPLELALPYLFQVTAAQGQGDARLVGVLLGALSLGALAGGAAAASLRGERERVRLILGGYLLHGALFVLFGVMRQPLLLGGVAFLLMFPLPLNAALLNTLLQNKIAPGMQGRVFGLTGQLFVLGTPLSFLATGALVDRVLEPAVGGPTWRLVAPLVGAAPGAGMGLLLVGVGLMILALTGLAALWPGVRHLERDLPDQPSPPPA